MENEKVYIRRRGGFSDRNKIHPVSTVLQTTDFSKDTRIVIKNRIIKFLEQFQQDHGLTDYKYETLIADFFAEHLFNIPLDSKKADYDNIMKLIFECIEQGTYDQVLDLIEFFADNFILVQHDQFGFNTNSEKYLYDDFNDIFETECIGFRFVNKQIVAITSVNEIQSINEACNTGIDQVNAHMEKAIEALKENGAHDYKKTISESVMALEALLKHYCPGKEDTVTKMLRVIDKKKEVHPTLKEAIQKLYWFASDEPGIRHENNKASNQIGFNEAKFALVTISAIINYLKPLF